MKKGFSFHFLLRYLEYLKIVVRINSANIADKKARFIEENGLSQEL